MLIYAHGAPSRLLRRFDRFCVNTYWSVRVSYTPWKPKRTHHHHQRKSCKNRAPVLMFLSNFRRSQQVQKETQIIKLSRRRETTTEKSLCFARLVVASLSIAMYIKLVCRVFCCDVTVALCTANIVPIVFPRARHLRLQFVSGLNVWVLRVRIKWAIGWLAACLLSS